MKVNRPLPMLVTLALAALADAIAGHRTQLANLCDMPWSFDQRVDRFTISIGYGDGQPIRYSPRRVAFRPVSDLDKQLFGYARKLKVPFTENQDVDRLVSQFLKDPK
jgi:hypothetical protein